MGLPLVLCALGVIAAASVATAHHSLSDYDSSRQTTVDGVVAQFQYVNPHPFITLDAKDSTGRVQRWRLELDNRREFDDIGMTAETIRSGDRVVVQGSPGRSQANILYVRRLDRPSDGYAFDTVGSRPRLLRPSR